ncbi:MAG: nuclear transport factor 2 family protein [Pseudomonadota bacterium]
MITKKLLIGAALAAATFANAEAFADTTNRDVIAAMFEAFNAHDVDALKAIYAPDAVVYSPESCEPRVGRDAIGASYAELFEQIPDVHDTVQTIVSEGNRAAVVFTAASRQPGMEFELAISAFLVIENGLVVEDRVFFDTDVAPACEETDSKAKGNP